MSTTTQTVRERAEIVDDLANCLAVEYQPMTIKVSGLPAQVTLKEMSAKLAAEHKADGLSGVIKFLPTHLAGITSSTRKSFHSLFKETGAGMTMPTLEGVAYAIKISKGPATVAAVRKRESEYADKLWTGIMGDVPRTASDVEKQVAWQAFLDKYIIPKVNAKFMQIVFPYQSADEYLRHARINFKVLPMSKAHVDDSMVMASEIRAGVQAQAEEIYESLIAAVDTTLDKMHVRVVSDSTAFSTATFNNEFETLRLLQSTIPESCIELHNTLRWIMDREPANLRTFFEDVRTLTDDRNAPKFQDQYRKQMAKHLVKAKEMLRA